MKGTVKAGIRKWLEAFWQEFVVPPRQPGIDGRNCLALVIACALAACQSSPPGVAPASVPNPTMVQQAAASPLVPVGTLSGRVAYYDGRHWQPVPGARVKVGGGDVEGLTDAEGRYHISGLAHGLHRLAVTKAGFSQEESWAKLSPVSGVAAAHVVLRPLGYALQQGAEEVTVTGVVKDPRGAALGGATVRYAATGTAGNGQVSATVTANAQGFFTFPLPGMGATEVSPAYLQVTAFGASPGGVRLESQAPVTRVVTTNAVVVHASCDAWTAPGAIAYPEGAFLGGDTPPTEAVFEVERISSRADEFYLELQDAVATYAVIANSVTPVDGATNPTRAVVRFRPPATLTGDSFTAYIRPFGGPRAAQGANFITRYTAPQFGQDVVATGANLEDATEVVTGGNYNQGFFVPGETARYTLELQNANGLLSQDTRVTGRAPAGTRLLGFLLSTWAADGTPLLVRTPQAAGSQFSIDVGTGVFELKGFSLPLGGRARIEASFGSAVTLDTETAFALSDLQLQMPSLGLVHPVPLASGGLQTMDPGVVRGDLNATDWQLSKEIEDLGAGRARVRLRIVPDQATAMGAIRIQDVTGTNLATQPMPAVLEGTVPAPAEGTPVGFSPGDTFVLQVDGAPFTVTALATWDLEQLCQAIEIITLDRVQAERSPADRLRITHQSIGASSTLAVDAGTSDALSALLGLTEGVPVAGDAGLSVTFPGVASIPIRTEGAPTKSWRFTETEAQHLRVAGQGRVSVLFTVVPPEEGPQPDVEASDTFDSPLLIEYEIQRDTPASYILGGGLGPRVVHVNPVAPYNDAFNDLDIDEVATADAEATEVTGAP